MYVINGDIKSSNLKSLYVLTGEEDYLIYQFRDKLVKAFTGKSMEDALQTDMNFARYVGKDTDVNQIKDFADTMPFLAEKRVVLIEDAQFNAEDGGNLADYLNRKPDYAYFIIVEHQLDKRSKLYKEYDKLGHISEFKEQDEELLRRWIVGMVQSEGKNITNGALNELLDRVGFHMTLLDKELEKLLCYCMDKEAIEQEDVKALISPQVGNHIFAMIEAIGNKDRQRALKLYYELLELKEAPMRILNLIGRQFTNLYAVKELRMKGFDKRRISEKMEIKPFIVDKYMGQAGKFDLEQLKEAIKDCTDYDARIKSGDIKDNMSVELLIIKYSS